MPEPLGILVDPMGPAESLSADEYAHLRTLLQIYRASDDRGKNFEELIGNLRFFFRGDHDTNSQSEILHKTICP
jgi:hypothetical protein